MSESENDEFKKQQSGANDNPLTESEESDPFALLSGSDEGENENTMQRLSHLEGNDSFASSDGESTTARLSSLLQGDDAPKVDAPEESTMARLAHINMEGDATDDTSDTLSRLENFAETFDEDEDAEEEEDDEQSDSSFLAGEGRGDLTDGLSEELGFSDSALAPFVGDSGSGPDGDFDSSFGAADLAAGAEAAVSENPAEEGTQPKKKGKKEKKTKKPKAKKPETAKKPKKKTTIGKTKPKEPWTSVDTALLLTKILCLLVWVGGNVWGIFVGAEPVLYLPIFNLFGLIFMFVPFLLQGKKRRYGAITLFDSMLAVALGLLVLGCMLLLMTQVRYGLQITVG